jgi:hypothetical protein
MQALKWTEQLGPADMVASLQRLTEVGFVAECAGAPLLLIRVEDSQTDLGTGLEGVLTGAARVPARPLGNLGFHTEVVSQRHLIAAAEQAAQADAARVQTIVRELATGTYYIAPLSKRRAAESAFVERVSVGRTMNTDIVLRDKSVSKYHAYFQVDDNGTHYLCDAASKNGTMVNGNRVPARQPVELSYGDRIVFGAIEAMLVAPSTLWRAVRTL